ncbi:MAG TPA: hypothetical protein VGD58_33010 [Herpetosiphonaceae bacterium]
MWLARHRPVLLFIGVALLLSAIETWIVLSVWFPRNADLLSLAITADLTLGIPALYYLLLVRPRKSPSIALAPVFIVSILLAHLILPPTQQFYLDRIKDVLPLVEGALLVVAGIKVRAVMRAYRRLRPEYVYATDALEASLRATFGKQTVVKLLTTELSLLYYLAVGWFRRFQPSSATDPTFSYHRANGYAAVLGMFGFVIALETIGLHLIVQHWSAGLAWVFTALSLYSLAWIIGDYHAARLHPIVLTPQTLHLRTGLRWRLDLDRSAIARVARATPGTRSGKSYLNLALFGEPRLILDLKEPVVVQGLFGIQRAAARIGLSVDDEARFLTELNKLMSAAG